MWLKNTVSSLGLGIAVNPQVLRPGNLTWDNGRQCLGPDYADRLLQIPKGLKTREREQVSVRPRSETHVFVHAKSCSNNNWLTNWMNLTEQKPPQFWILAMILLDLLARASAQRPGPFCSVPGPILSQVMSSVALDSVSLSDTVLFFYAILFIFLL